MQKQSKHIIRKLFVDVLYHSPAEGLQLQREVTDWCRNHLLPRLEAMLEGRWQDEEQVQVSALEIELAMEDTQAWQQPALAKMELLLNDKLQFHLHGADEVVSKTLTRSFEDQFVFFLLKGYLPWWTDVASHDAFLELLQEWARSESRTVNTIAMALQLHDAQKRLLYLLPDKPFFVLLATVYGDQEAIPHSFIAHTQRFLEALPLSEFENLPYDIKQLLLELLAAGVPDVRATFVNALIDLLVRRKWIITYDRKVYAISTYLRNAVTSLLRATEMEEQWVMGEQLIADKLQVEMQHHTVEKVATAVAPAGTGGLQESGEQPECISPARTIEQEEHHTRAPGEGRSIIERASATGHGEKQPTSAKENDRISKPRTESGKPPARKPAEEAETTAQKNRPTGNESNVGTEDRPENLVGATDLSEINSTTETAGASSGHLTTTDNAPIREPQAGEQVSAPVNQGEKGPQGLEEHQEKEIRQSLLRTVLGITDEENAIYIANSGLMILAPFLPVFFKRMDLLQNDGIADYPKAILLLHYLATGDTTAAEYETVLPKILCGLEPEHPVNLQREWQEGWAAECRDLLRSVIEYWSILKDTSLEGLRDAFLQRKGKLSKGEREWLLQVEQKPYDMLLQQLPWNISMIQLGWMKTMIRTEWT